MNIFEEYRIGNLNSVVTGKKDDESLLDELYKLREICGKLDQIIENAPDGIYITDGDANAIRINPAFERISGLKREDMLGRNHRDLEKDGIVAKSSALMVVEQRKPVTIIHEYLPTNRQALVTSCPIFDENGNISLIVSNIRDLTELNELRAELAEHKNRLIRYERQIEELKKKLIHSDELVIEDKKMLDVMSLVNRVAGVDSTILLTGETGVGKDEIAKYIHSNSIRGSAAFLEVNCGSIPEHLVESELFGYEKGAFTGAQQTGKIGILEAANRGTLFLDEVGELPMNAQVKLLKVLQTRNVTRVGGTKPIPVDVRIIAATNRDLNQMVRENRFRQDLYYRLSVIPIQIPPLRERVDDIIPLAKRFLEDVNNRYGYQKSFTNRAYRELINYSWPGNIRELKNFIERCVVTTDGDLITEKCLTINRDNDLNMNYDSDRLPVKERLEKIEYQIMLDAYEKFHSVRKAADYLGMAMSTYVRKRRAYDNKYKMKAKRQDTGMILNRLGRI